MTKAKGTPVMALVYEVTNLVNGKRYIGFTSNTLAYRERQHRSYGRKGRGHIFHKALRKYGDENFVFRVMADFEGDVDLAKLYEFEAIEKYRPEYNIRAGGEGGGPIAESTRAKMSAAQKGRVSPLRGAPISAAHRQAIIDGKAKRDNRHSEETRAKIKAAVAGRLYSEAEVAALRARQHEAVEYIKVPVKCLDDGRVFESCSAADKYYGFRRATVNNAVNSGRKTFGRSFVRVGK